jgi:hypothetical protein
MRYVMTAGVLLLAAFLGAAQAPSDTPAFAKVTVGGEIRDLLELRSKLNVGVLLDVDQPLPRIPLGWDGPPPQQGTMTHRRSMQVGDAAWVVVLLDETDKNLSNMLPKLRAPAEGGLHVVLEGVIAASKDQNPFVVHAKAWGTMRVVEGQAKDAPGMGEITVKGQALAGKFEVSKGNFTPLAVENGSSPILVTGKAVEQAAAAKGAIVVHGKLLIQKQGPLVVEAKEIEVKAPPSKKPGPDKKKKG